MAVFIQQTRAVRYTDQRTCAVEQIDQKEDKHHCQHTAVEQTVEIHLHKRGGSGRHAGNDAVKLCQTQGGGNAGNGQNADDNCAADFVIIQCHDKEKTEQRQKHGHIGKFYAIFDFIQIVHFQQRGIAGNHQTGAFQGNQCQKQADTGGNRHFQTHGQRINQHFTHFEKAEQDENHSRHKNGCQRNLPAHAHTLHHVESKISIQTHAWGQRNRVIGKRAHDEAADCR